jgi:hypothetical protein
MSHYVVAWLPEGRLPLNNGMPIGALMGLDHSGLSVYGEYEQLIFTRASAAMEAPKLFIKNWPEKHMFGH